MPNENKFSDDGELLEADPDVVSRDYIEVQSQKKKDSYIKKLLLRAGKFFGRGEDFHQGVLMDLRGQYSVASREKDWERIDAIREQMKHAYHAILQDSYVHMTLAAPDKQKKAAQDLFDICRGAFDQSLHYISVSLFEDVIFFMKRAENEGKMGMPRQATEHGERTQDEYDRKHSEKDRRARALLEKIDENRQEIERFMESSAPYDAGRANRLFSKCYDIYREQKDDFYREFYLLETSSYGVEIYEKFGANVLTLRQFIEEHERSHSGDVSHSS